MSAVAFDTFIFVPAYNVENTLAGVLDKIPESVWNRSKVLVINDGSKDETEKVAREYCAEMENCTGQNDRAGRLEYFAFEKNSGYGAVVKKGLTEGIASGAQFVACLHGDGQYPADMLDKFLDHLENFREVGVEQCRLALLQGSRHAVSGGAKAGHMPFYKRLGGAFLTALENCVFTYKLTDRHSGFIFYRTEFLKCVDLEKLSPSFDIDLELISIADAMATGAEPKFALGELPIPTVYADEKSNLNVVNYGLRCLKQILRRLLRK
ncbi:MAG: glycosyltransferase family 2 protein [Fibrobacter sp.]|nr:glycosyltransferase family 2 protein [Fibrobacter sp.]